MLGRAGEAVEGDEAAHGVADEVDAVRSGVPEQAEAFAQEVRGACGGLVVGVLEDRGVQALVAEGREEVGPDVARVVEAVDEDDDGGGGFALCVEAFERAPFAHEVEAGFGREARGGSAEEGVEARVEFVEGADDLAGVFRLGSLGPVGGGPGRRAGRQGAPREGEPATASVHHGALCIIWSRRRCSASA